MDKWLNHPTALKIISVVIGLLLWAVVHIDPETSPQTVTSNIDTKIIEAAPIVPIGLDDKQYKLTAMEPTVARLVVEGRISNLYAASNDSYIVNLDLTNAKPGIQELPLTVKLPKGIQKVELSPQTVTVRIEKIVTKPFELQIITEGQPAEGYILGTPAVLTENGGTVNVTLPEDDMDRVGVVGVTIDVGGAEKTVSNKKASIVVYDKDGAEMTDAVVSPDTVHVEAPVTLPFKQVPFQLRYTGALADGLSIVSVKPEVDQVTVYAWQTDLDSIQTYDGAVLDLSKVKQSGVIKVKAAPIDGIKWVSPAEIALDIVVESTETQMLPNLPITINGIPDGMSAQIRMPASGKIDLQVSGSESVLSQLKVSDVRLIAQVEGLAPGIHTVPLEIELPSYVQPVLPNGQTLTVEIEIIDDSEPAGGEIEEGDPGGSATDPPEEAAETGEPDGDPG